MLKVKSILTLIAILLTTNLTGGKLDQIIIEKQVYGNYNQTTFIDLFNKNNNEHLGFAQYESKRKKINLKNILSLSLPKPKLILNVLMIDKEHRNKGLGAVFFTHIIKDITKSHPNAKTVEWQVALLDPPKDQDPSKTKDRLFNFYRRLDAKVDNKGRASYNLLTIKK